MLSFCWYQTDLSLLHVTYLNEPVLLYFRHCHCAVSPVPFLAVNDDSVKARKFNVIFSREGFLGQEVEFRKEVGLDRAQWLWFS